MKTLTILLMAFVFLMTIGQTQAQEKGRAATEKAAIKETKNEIKAEKKELKNEKEALRKLEGNNVNVISKSSLLADFGKLSNVNWKRTEYFDEATFTKDGKELTAYYDFFGKLVGTCSPKAFSDIPASAQKEIKTKYKDYSIGQVIFFDDNEFNEGDMMLYNTQFNDEDHYFVEVKKGSTKIILMVNPSGVVTYFKEL